MPASKPVVATRTSKRPSSSSTLVINSTSSTSSSTSRTLRLPLSSASVGMPLSFMNLYSISRGIRRNRDPGTRNPLSCPLSKQRIMVCWLTLQILAASPVVKTVFMGSSTPFWPRHPTHVPLGTRTAEGSVPQVWSHQHLSVKCGGPKSSLIRLYHSGKCAILGKLQITAHVSADGGLQAYLLAGYRLKEGSCQACHL